MYLNVLPPSRGVSQRPAASGGMPPSRGVSQRPASGGMLNLSRANRGGQAIPQVLSILTQVILKV